MTRRKPVSWEDRYKKCDEQLGCGGNAKVYKAYRLSDNSQVALKELENRTSEKKKRFIQEIEIMEEYHKLIDGILPIIDASKTEYWYCMPIAQPVMKWKTSSEAKLRVSQILLGIVEIAKTLIFLHEDGVSHRDIKPDNIYYFNNRFCLGDFGLVELPDSLSGLTVADRPLGPIFTIAPEMKRDPQNADGKKADVFSLAKTMWILLTQEEKGFDGIYNSLDPSIGLRFRRQLSKIHIVELDDLLAITTANDPASRPTMKVFCEKLEEYLEILSDDDKSQHSDWKSIKKQLFSEYEPKSVSWEKADTIIRVLNIIGESLAYNHMMFSGLGGGLDFSCAKYTAEPGCIELIVESGISIICKPKVLIFESFGNEYKWDYFLLELCKLRPILSESDDCEELVEDKPGHYTSATYAQYGVYDYESGVPFPSEWRVINRYISGKMLFVFKWSPYNGISVTYDGRHGQCTSSEFREYIDTLRISYNKAVSAGIPELDIITNKEFSKNPFVHNADVLDIQQSSYDLTNVTQFLSGYNLWSFNQFLHYPIVQSNIVFYFKLSLPPDICHPMDAIFNPIVLCINGHFEKQAVDQLGHAYCLYSRQDANKLIKECSDYLKQIVASSGYDERALVRTRIDAFLRRCGKPTHLFTLEEIRAHMENADDRKNNILVIDENGYALIIHDTLQAQMYPVRNETWVAGNNYVGKFSRLYTLQETYQDCLYGWLRYLESNNSVYIDYNHSIDIQQTIEEISVFY